MKNPTLALPALAQSAPRLLPWWATPAGLCLGFLLPILLVIAAVGTVENPVLTIRGLRFLDLRYLGLGAALLGVAALGGWIGHRLALPAPAAAAPLRRWDAAASVAGLIALAAYLFWFRDILLSPSMLWQTLTGAWRPDRSNIDLTPGLTSLANVAPAFFAVYAWRALLSREPVPGVVHALAALLIALTAFRVYAWSERLALIEAALPFGLAMGARLRVSPRPWVRALVLAGPFAALPALVLYFGIAEYARAWSSPTYAGKTGFWEFALGRMASYYYTSLNNGAGLLETLDWPTGTFEHTLFWLHRAPLDVGPSFSSWLNVVGFQPEAFLDRYGDPEFNNPSGLYAIVSDLGIAGAAAYLAVIALLGGLLVNAYAQGRLIGLLLYPMVFLSFLEIFRYPYLGQPRAFTCFLGIVLVLLIASVRWSAPRERWLPSPQQQP